MELFIGILILYLIIRTVSPDKPKKRKQRKPLFKKRYDLDRRQSIHVFEEKMQMRC